MAPTPDRTAYRGGLVIGLLATLATFLRGSTGRWEGRDYLVEVA